jgi:hypothetical protein
MRYKDCIAESQSRSQSKPLDLVNQDQGSLNNKRTPNPPSTPENSGTAALFFQSISLKLPTSLLDISSVRTRFVISPIFNITSSQPQNQHPNDQVRRHGRYLREIRAGVVRILRITLDSLLCAALDDIPLIICVWSRSIIRVAAVQSQQIAQRWLNRTYTQGSGQRCWLFVGRGLLLSSRCF